MNRKIRVLIIDDSMLFREVLTKGISSDEGIVVVAKAVDPFDARDKILSFKPDVVTCDIEMPKMNGIDFVRKLIPQYPVPVIVVSSVSEAVFDALDAGAVDFLAKPGLDSIDQVQNFFDSLINKIKMASSAKIRTNEQNQVQKEKNTSLPRSVLMSNKYDTDRIIAIGASTGGTESIYSVLKKLPPNIPGIVIVQHIPPLFSRLFAERLNNNTDFNVKEAVTGDLIEPNKILVAPGDKHMVVVKIGDTYKVEVYEGEKVNGHCPSVDVLFESVAKVCKDKAVGVILTGMGYDGAKGLLSIKRKGGKTIGQDEESSVVYGMPKVAYDVGAVLKQVSLDDVPQTICSMLKKN